MDIKAAWAPESIDLPWDEAAELATAWLLTQCDADASKPFLVTNTLDQHDGVEVLEALASAYGHTSSRASRDRVPNGPLSVLAYVPYADDLVFAQRLACGHSLAVVEAYGFRVGGWAQYLGAWDLVAHAPTPRDQAFVDLVDGLARNGNNAFGDTYGRERARSTLRRVDAVTRELLPGAVLAAGLSSRAARNLAALVERS